MHRFKTGHKSSKDTDLIKKFTCNMKALAAVVISQNSKSNESPTLIVGDKRRAARSIY